VLVAEGSKGRLVREAQRRQHSRKHLEGSRPSLGTGITAILHLPGQDFGDLLPRVGVSGSVDRAGFAGKRKPLAFPTIQITGTYSQIVNAGPISSTLCFKINQTPRFQASVRLNSECTSFSGRCQLTTSSTPRQPPGTTSFVCNRFFPKLAAVLSKR